MTAAADGTGFRRRGHGHARVTYAELFFDLITLIGVAVWERVSLGRPAMQEH